MHRVARQLQLSRLGPSPAWWQWPSVLSLELPLIAVSWRRLLGSVLGARVPLLESLLLGLAVWLIYSADRLLDSFCTHPGSLGSARGNTTVRHHFYITHRRSVVTLWLLVGVVALGLALTVLSSLELLAGTLLGLAVLGYFLCRHHGQPEYHPKELQIAILFALGVSLIPLLNGAALIPIALFTLLFAFLLFLNCGFLALWEEGHDLEPSPFAARAPRTARQLPDLALLPLTVCLLGILTAARALPLFAALGSSALLLYGLDHTPRTRLGPEALRVAGDAALLTPLLFLIVCLTASDAWRGFTKGSSASSTATCSCAPASLYSVSWPRPNASSSSGRATVAFC